MLDKQLKGAKAIAVYLGRSTGTVMRLWRQEDLPIHQIGGIWESSQKDLDEWKEHKRMNKTYERKERPKKSEKR